MYVKGDSDIFTIDMSSKDGLKDNSVLDRLNDVDYYGVDYWGNNKEDISISKFIILPMKESDSSSFPLNWIWRWKNIVVFRVHSISDTDETKYDENLLYMGDIDETKYNEDLWFITGLDNVYGYSIFECYSGNDADDITKCFEEEESSAEVEGMDSQEYLKRMKKPY